MVFLPLLFVFTAAMKYSLISVMEYRFGVFPPGTPEKILEEKNDFEPILLLPSARCDFEMRLRDGKGEDEFLRSAALSALEFYFFKIRGLPKMEMVISHSVSNFTLDGSNKILFKFPKCKYKFTKERLELQGADVECYRSDDILVFPAENLTHFEESVFKTASLRTLCGGGKLLAFSREGKALRIKLRGGSSIEFAAILSYLVSLNDEFKKGDLFDFLFDSGRKMKVENLGNLNFEAKLQCELSGFFEYL